MAFISTYANTSPVVAADRMLATDSAGATKNILASDLSDFIYPRDIINTTVTNYTLQLATANKTLTYTGAGAANFTIETELVQAFTIGDEVLVANQTAFAITILSAVGVTAWGSGTIAAGASARFKKTAANTWSVY